MNLNTLFPFLGMLSIALSIVYNANSNKDLNEKNRDAYKLSSARFHLLGFELGFEQANSYMNENGDRIFPIFDSQTGAIILNGSYKQEEVTEKRGVVVWGESILKEANESTHSEAEELGWYSRIFRINKNCL